MIFFIDCIKPGVKKLNEEQERKFRYRRENFATAAKFRYNSEISVQ